MRFGTGVRMIGFLIAVLSGVLMSVQGVFNTQVTKASSIWAANVFVQFSALLVCLAAWGITDRTNLLSIWKVEPKYMLLGGVMGAAITWTVIRSMDALVTGKGSAVYRSGADSGGLCDRAVRAFWKQSASRGNGAGR